MTRNACFGAEIRQECCQNRAIWFLLHNSNSAVSRYSVLSYKRFIYSRAALRLLPGQVLTQGRALRWSTSAACVGARLKTATARSGLCCSNRAACRRPLSGQALRPPPAYIQVPLAASALVHAHCPHACGTLASSVYSTIGGPNSSWKPPARHNQESDLSWLLKIWVNERCCCNLFLSTRWKYLKVESTACMVCQNQDSNLSWLLKNWVNEPCCCNLFLSACWKYLKVKSTACMIGHRSWQFGSKEWREYWQ